MVIGENYSLTKKNILSILFRICTMLIIPIVTSLFHYILKRYIMSINHNILIIDDEQEIHKLIKSALDIKGIPCLHAYNGKEGLALYQKHNPTMVFLDIGMPVMNGIEFLRILKPSSEALRSIVICSADDEPEFIDCCRDLGFRSYLRKPFHVNDVMSLASSCVKDKIKAVS